MRKLSAVLFVAAALGAAGRARAADGIVDLSWHACSPIVLNLTTNVSQPWSIYASVTGFDVPQKGYDVVLAYGNARGVPDAWRFDPTGCPGLPFVKIDHLAPAAVAATCPSFQGAMQSVQVKSVDIFVAPADLSGFPIACIRVALSNNYPVGIPAMNPGVRYFLGRFVFDHTYSVAGEGNIGLTCGGFEQSMCFKLVQSDYVDLSGVTRNFGRHPGATYLTFNGPEGCVGPTPTRSTTWGSLKVQYR